MGGGDHTSRNEWLRQGCFRPPIEKARSRPEALTIGCAELDDPTHVMAHGASVIWFNTSDSLDLLHLGLPFAYTYHPPSRRAGAVSVRSLDNSVQGNLKCYFGGFAVQVQGPRTESAGKASRRPNPRTAEFDEGAARKARNDIEAEIAYAKTGIDSAQPEAQGTRQADALVKVRQKVVDTLKGSTEISEVGDLYKDGRFKRPLALGAFSPIFFVYSRPGSPRPEGEAQTRAGKSYFIYNGTLLLAAAFCEPEKQVPAVEESVTEVCHLISSSGFDFRRLSPIPAPQSFNLSDVSLAVSQTAGVLNDSVGRTLIMTSVFARMPRTVHDALRSLYASSFPHLMSFYALRDVAESRDALIEAIEAQRGALMDLMRELNLTKERHLLKRRRLRKLIRAHSLGITEKIGRADALSDSLSQGAESLDLSLKESPAVRAVLESEPGWRGYLGHDFDTKRVLDVISQTNEVMSHRDTGSIVLWVAVLAGAIGGLVGFLVSKLV